MCLIDPLKNKYLIVIDLLAIFVINIVHIVFGFLIKYNYFDPYNLFGSSPLFDFSISKDCKDKSAISFHQWGGRLEKKWTLDNDFNVQYYYEAYDQTDLKKINGYYFCYRYISYKDLLYNLQIIKKGTECPSEYKKNCGRIDTLEQELCIKENEKCPLYDIGIGNKSNDENYIQ